MSDLHLKRGMPAVPRHLVNRDVLSPLLARLPQTGGMMWIQAPVHSGKRTAVAAWAADEAHDRRVVWLGRAPAGLDPADAVPAVIGAVDRLRGRARGHPRSTHEPALIVVDLGAHPVRAETIDGLRDVAADLDGLQLLVIQDRVASSDDAAPLLLVPDVDEDDLRLRPATIRAELALRGLALPDALIARIFREYAGNAGLFSAFLASLSEHPGLGVREGLASAHARMLLDTAQRLFSRPGLDLVVLLTLVEELAFEEIRDHLETATDIGGGLGLLVDRGLLEQRRLPGGDVAYRLSGSVRETIRVMTLARYLEDRAVFHRAAARHFERTGHPARAIRHLLTARRPDEAVEAMRRSWDRHRDAERELLAIAAEIPPASLLRSLEAAAAVRLLHSALPAPSIAAALAVRILGATEAEIGALDLRGRSTVRAARASIQLDRGRPEAAAETIADALSDLERDQGRDRAVLGSAHVELLLAAGRASVHAGALREGRELLDEALAFGHRLSSGTAVYRALVGRGTVLALNGELAAAQRALDRAADLEQELGLTASRTAQERTWCQGLVWAYRGRFEKVRALARSVRDRAAADPSWEPLADVLEARVLLRSGFRVEAASLLRTVLSSLEVWTDQPVFRRAAACLLGLALVTSNRPGAAMAAVGELAENRDHAPCLAGVRALALVMQGDPVAALRATDACVAKGHSHANLPLVHVHIARALAFEATGLEGSAEEAFLTALGIADGAGMRLGFEDVGGPPFARLVVRAGLRAPQLAERVVDAVVPASERGDVPGGPFRPRPLTEKERDVLRQLIGPRTLAEIGAALFVSENTVKTHVRNIYRKLGVTSRREAGDIAVSWGLTPTVEAAALDVDVRG